MAPEPGAAPRHRLRWAVLVFGVLLLVFVGLGVLCWIQAQTYPVGQLARAAPRRTALMEQRAAEAKRHGKSARADQRWVSYERVSPMLRSAVLVAEDDAFFQHGGFDWNEINASMRRNLEERKVARGGSTITQQLARNLFLGDHRTITRKLTEAFVAMRLERALSKRRIFELYLNLIEWGDGIYGIESASRAYYGVPASALDARQSVLLAAVIINPRRYSVEAPNKRIERRARMIAGRLRRRGKLDEYQYAAAVGRPAPTTIPGPPGVPIPPFLLRPAPAEDQAPAVAETLATEPPAEAAPAETLATPE